MAEETKKDEVLVAVGPGAEEADEPIRDSADEADESAEEGHHEGAEDERIGHGEDEEEDGDSRRSRRSEERKRRKERQRRELNFLRARNEQLEREQSRRLAEIENRQVQGEVLAIDGRIANLEDQIRQAEEIHAKAVEKGDGESASEALRIRDQFKDGLQRLQGVKAQTVRGATARAQQPEEADPAIAERAREWAEANDWFDPNLGDEDSTIAKAIEMRLYKEGRLDPRSAAYWKELDRRLKHRLPDKYSRSREHNAGDEEDEMIDDNDDDRDEERSERSNRQARRTNGNGGPSFRTGGRERALKRGEVYVDADRRKVMEEMGVWEDEQLRNRYLKSYQKYDRENGRRRRSS